MSNFITTVTIRARTWVMFLMNIHDIHSEHKYQQTDRNASDFDLFYNCACF